MRKKATMGGCKLNVLFLTLIDFRSLNERGIYQDLLRQFVKHGHFVYAVSPVERRTGKTTELIMENNARILKLKCGNVQKTNLIEKGLSTITLEGTFISGIKKYYSDIKFDLILYTTPPITLQRAVAYVKNRDNAKTYLLLKDIFPQNAVDMGILNRTGLRALIYYYFRFKERRLYMLSDYIGCMSQANCDFIIQSNHILNPENVEVCPNSVEAVDLRLNHSDREEMRKKYEIPLDKTVFVYGGNLGRPQGVPFIIECLKTQMKNPETYFLIVGDGTEFIKLEAFFKDNQPENMKLMKRLPKEDYDHMIASCDVGLIFLDHRFTIPNFPSRLLSYLQAGLPVLASTDPYTDIGKICVAGGFGWWCESDNVNEFAKIVETVCESELKKMGAIGYQYLCENFSAEKSYITIMKHCQQG